MRRRQGFTLVELLVAMALIIFIMAILSQAFVAAMATFRNLKSLGDMAEKLRSTTQLLQHDLAADHFEGKKRLSDSYFWLNGPPQQGFFQISQGTASATTGPNNFIESLSGDPFGINSYRSTDHQLAFTVKLRGSEMGDFFSASGNMSGLSGQFGPVESRYQGTSGGSYNYQWAAVAWFLKSSGGTTSTGVPLYNLYRRQALLVPDNSLVPTQSYPVPPTTTYNTLIANFLETSCWGNPLSNPPGSTPGSLYFNSPIDITDPPRRYWGGDPIYTAIGTGLGTLSGSDIQLTDVVSFDVRMLFQGMTTGTDPFVTLWQAPFTVLNTAGGLNNGNPSFWNVQTNLPSVMVFDTWTSINDGLSNYSQWNTAGQATSIPLWNPNANPQSGPIIQAIQISIRIWDYKTNQTRQVTIVQAM